MLNYYDDACCIDDDISCTDDDISCTDDDELCIPVDDDLTPEEAAAYTFECRITERINYLASDLSIFYNIKLSDVWEWLIINSKYN